MNNLFNAAYSFNGDITTWDTSALTSMWYMFRSAVSFNQPIGNWNVSNVTNMSNTFALASAFKQNVAAWNMTKVTNATEMFAGSTLLPSFVYDALLSSWATQTLKANLSINFGLSRYSALGAAARASIISTYGWTITDGGVLQ